MSNVPPRSPSRRHTFFPGTCVCRVCTVGEGVVQQASQQTNVITGHTDDNTTQLQLDLVRLVLQYSILQLVSLKASAHNTTCWLFDAIKYNCQLSMHRNNHCDCIEHIL